MSLDYSSVNVEVDVDDIDTALAVDAEIDNDIDVSAKEYETSPDFPAIVKYSMIIDKPKIEGVTLEGDKTYEELNLKGISNTEMEQLLTF